MARMVLPVNLYTEWYWTVNARALMHFIALRSEAHAQWETRQYSNALWSLWAPLMPFTAEALLGTLDLRRYQASSGLPGPNLESIRA
jgi:thymidylate synthase (FAD)